jgi:DNA (cytosine-5)-methyltransferase 3A
MNVLSLFDGMSCGQQALERVGIKVDNYFASEIDKYAITVTMANYPNTKQLGSVVNVDGYSLPKIDLLIGGSPCQSFSFAGKRKGMSTKDEQEILTLDHYLELKSQEYEFEGQSYLFWEYMRLLNEVKPKYFLLENVMMGEKWEKILSKAIGVNPIMINSSLVSAQNRQRLYWTNIGMKPSGLFGDLESIIEQPKDLGILLKDILEPEVDEKYFLSQKMIDGFLGHNKNHEGKTGFVWQPTEGNKKGACLRANAALAATDNSIIVHNIMPRSSKIGKGDTGPLKREDGKTYCLDTGQTNAIEIIATQLGNSEKFGNSTSDKGKAFTLRTANPNGVILNSKVRRLTPIECERLQTVKDNYTNHVSDSQRYKMLGNGWTVDVIAHIFKYI